MTTPTEPDLDLIAQRAAAVARDFAATEPRARATALVAVADALDRNAAELIAIAMRE